MCDALVATVIGLEGERAQRSEVQCKLRDVEKTLAALKNPEWWGPAQLARCAGEGGSAGCWGQRGLGGVGVLSQGLHELARL